LIRVDLKFGAIIWPTSQNDCTSATAFVSSCIQTILRARVKNSGLFKARYSLGRKTNLYEISCL